MSSLKNLKIVKRDLKFQNNTITDLSLDSLKEVNGEIIIKENNKLTDLNLKSLDTVTKFTLENNELLQGKETEEGEKVDVKPANQVAFEGAGTSPIFNKDTLEQNNINIQNVNLESLTIDESKVDLNPKRIGNIVALNNGLPKNFKVEDGKQVYSSDINIELTDIKTEYQGYDKGVLAKNGKIYCPPFGDKDGETVIQRDKVLEIDPTGNTVTFKYVGDKIGEVNQFGKYAGGVLANNGKIYCPPFGNGNNDDTKKIEKNTKKILVINPKDGGKNVEVDYIDSDVGDDNQYIKYYGGVLAKNGKIYCPPYGDSDDTNTRKILEINPSDNTFSYINYSIGSNNQYSKYIFGVLANNGKIYCPPFGDGDGDNTREVLVITPNDGGKNVEVDYIDGVGDDNQYEKYIGGVLANNGKIYCPPYGDVHEEDDQTNTRKILEINPIDNTFSYINYSIGSNNQYEKYVGGVLANNGKIYCLPYGTIDDDSENTKKILVITPNDGGESVKVDFIEKPIGSTIQSNKYTGGVLANNGKIYCNPANFDKLLVIDLSGES